MPIADNLKTHLQVVVRGTMAAGGASAKSTTNVLYYRRTAFAANYTGAAFLAAFHAAVRPSWLACANLNWSWNTTDVRVINDPTELAVTSVVNLPGLAPGQALPSYAAILMSKITGLRTGSYRGRLYFAGVSEDGNSGNALTDAHKILADAVATALTVQITDANAVTFVPFNLAASLSNLRRATPLIIGADITSFAAKQKLSIQKRRKAK